MATETIPSLYNLFGRLATVTGTTGAENVETYIAFPSGFNAGNCIYVGNVCKNSNNLYYSNNAQVVVFTDSNSGVRVKVTSSAFANKSISVVLLKI